MARYCGKLIFLFMAVSDTLRGYRTQFLYTLYRILKTDNPGNEVFRPEGIEDLDILVDGKVVESIQVKNHRSGKLGYENLKSSAGTTSFFIRSSKTHRAYPDAKLKVFSFHGVKEELTNKKLLIDKLEQDNAIHLPVYSIKRLTEKFEVEEKSEEYIYEQVVAALKDKFPSANPENEIKLLVQWISLAAEDKKDITYRDLIGVREKYTTFVNEQTSVLSELGNTVVRLEDSNAIDLESAKRDYHEGVSARMYHIQAGFDVLRSRKLEQIKSYFTEKNIVVLHGNSGQGKSSLAYRYIYSSGSIAYEITNSNVANVRKIISTLSVLAKDLPWKILFYFDVVPSNAEWVQIVSEFANAKNVLSLITIRQEDWNQKKNLIKSESTNFSEMEILLTEDEAKDIYDCVKTYNTAKDMSFEDAWKNEGKHGSLLEFIYYITHGQSLKARISHQIESMSDASSRELLAYIALGNMLAGSITTDCLSKISKVSALEVERLVKTWNKEYFVVLENQKLTDIHPIRTKLIVEQLFNDNTNLLVKYGLNLYKESNPQCTDIYLLRLMNEGLKPEVLIEWCRKVERLTPVQYYGVAKSLLWKGIYDYEKTHAKQLDLLREKMRDSWCLFLPFNFTEIDMQKSLDELFGSKNAQLSDLTSILEGFAPQSKIFKYVEDWTDSNKLLLRLETKADWIKVGELLYILSQLNSLPKFEIEAHVIDTDVFSLEELATILLGFKSANRNDDFLNDIEQVFVSKLRFKYNIVRFELSEKRLEIVSFLDYYSTKDDQDKKGFITEKLNIAIIELCRRAFPTVNEYYAEFANDVITSAFPDIPKEKCISRVNLPLSEMTEYRKILTNLYRRTYLLPDRKVYAIECASLRDKYSKVAYEIARSLEKWSRYKTKDTSVFADAYKYASELEKLPLIEIPRTEISEYGFDFSTEDGSSDLDQLRHINVSKNPKSDIEEFNKMLSGFTTSLNNFFKQSALVILGNNVTDNLRISIANLYDGYEKLEVMQVKFREALGDCIDADKLDQIEESENANYKMIWVLWEAFCKNSYTILDSVSLVRRYDIIQKNLLFNVIKEIKGYGGDYLHLNEECVNGGSLKMDCSYTDVDSKQDNIEDCIYAVNESLSVYNYFSSERLVLSRRIKEILINPIYTCSGQKSNLDSQYTTIPLDRFFGNEEVDMSSIARNPGFDENISAYNQCPEVKKYNQIVSVLYDIVITYANMISAGQNVMESDKIGVEVLQNYVNKSRDRFLENKIPYVLSLKKELATTDDEVNNYVCSVIDALAVFYSELETDDDWWLSCQDLLDMFIEVSSHDFQIKSCLTNESKYGSY